MVYFITDGQHTKIGVAENVEKRLRELQTGNSRELVNKIKLHKEAMVSRPTIDKKWMDKEFRLKDYVDGLNQQITT